MIQYRAPYSRTVILSAIMISFLCGLGLARKGFVGVDMSVLLALAFAVVVFRRVRLANILALIGLFVYLGIARGAVVQSQIIIYDDYFGEQVTIEAQIFNDPRYSYRGQTEFLLSNVAIDGRSLPGTVRVRTYESIGLQRGDKLEVAGKLRSGFGNYQASLSFASVDTISRSGSPIELIRREYFAGVYSSIPEPQASLGLGFLVGLRALLPELLLDQLSVTGLTHIVAVSGYNLTVLIRLTKRWFYRRSRFVALIMSLLLMAVFLAITGGAASIVRASVVATTALVGWYFGRTIHPLILLLFSAVVTAGVNPLFLWFDIGWWLSFLAFFGVLILAPALQLKLFRGRKLGLIGQTLLETTSAQIMALPLIMTLFGELSIISLLANVIILPLIPIAMLLTFIAGSAGVLWPAVAGWLAWPAVQLLSFMTTVIYLLSEVPGASGEVIIQPEMMYAFYGCVVVMLLVMAKKRKLPAVDLL